jgi:hypothetical protein
MQTRDGEAEGLAAVRRKPLLFSASTIGLSRDAIDRLTPTRTVLAAGTMVPSVVFMSDFTDWTRSTGLDPTNPIGDRRVFTTGV